MAWILFIIIYFSFQLLAIHFLRLEILSMKDDIVSPEEFDDGVASLKCNVVQMLATCHSFNSLINIY